MVRELKLNEIYDFIDFGDDLYKNDPYYVPYFREDLKKTIQKLVFEEKKYKALVNIDNNGNIQGRVLLTIGNNKQLKTENCGYFSHLEVIDDFQVFNELLLFAQNVISDMGGEYLLGSFFPYDPDNRRGILVSGFEFAPMIFTSHNLPYYGRFFEEAGFVKLTDALEYEYKENPQRMNKIAVIADKSLEKYNVHVSKLNFNNIEKDIMDIQKIMDIASTEINFETVLSVEELTKIFNEWKIYINPDFVFIVRKNDDNSPVGFTFSILNYNEIIRKMNGRINLKGLFIFFKYRKRLKGLRCMLQYVVPEYQKTGVLSILYNETNKSVKKYKIQRVSLGTIMEKNISSNGVIVSAGGELSRVYRLFYKKIE